MKRALWITWLRLVVFSHYLQGFLHPRWWTICFHQQYFTNLDFPWNSRGPISPKTSSSTKNLGFKCQVVWGLGSSYRRLLLLAIMVLIGENQLSGVWGWFPPGQPPVHPSLIRCVRVFLGVPLRSQGCFFSARQVSTWCAMFVHVPRH